MVNQWNVSLLSELVPPHIVHMILGIPIPNSLTPDQPCWGLASSGDFSVKMAIWLAHGITPATTPWQFNWIWKIDIAPKIQIFLWQCLQNGLPLKYNLGHRQITIDNLCPICRANFETIDHLFFSCPSISQYWNSHIIRQKFVI